MDNQEMKQKKHKEKKRRLEKGIKREDEQQKVIEVDRKKRT